MLSDGAHIGHTFKLKFKLKCIRTGKAVELPSELVGSLTGGLCTTVAAPDKLRASKSERTGISSKQQCAAAGCCTKFACKPNTKNDPQ